MLGQLYGKVEQFKSSENTKFIVQETLTIHTSPENSKRTEWEFLKMITTLYNNSE